MAAIEFRGKVQQVWNPDDVLTFLLFVAAVLGLLLLVTVLQPLITG